MEEQTVRAAIDRHWAASAAGDQVGEHEIYHDDAVCIYPQSGEVIHGRQNLQALRSHHPGKPSGFVVRRIVGEGNLWVTEYAIDYEGKSAFTVKHHGIPGRKGRARDPVLCRPFRSSGLAPAMGRRARMINMAVSGMQQVFLSVRPIHVHSMCRSPLRMEFFHWEWNRDFYEINDLEVCFGPGRRPPRQI